MLVPLNVAMPEYTPLVPAVKIEHQPRKYDIKSEEIGLLLLNVRTLLQHQDDQMAELLLMRILKVDSKNVLALEYIYQVHQLRRNYSACVVIAKNIYKLQNDFSSCQRLAQLYYQMGDDQSALDKYFETLSVLGAQEADLFDVYKNIGNIFTRFADYDAAEEYYNKAYTLNPNSDVLHVNFGTLALQKNDVEKAKSCFHKAVELNRSNSQAWTGLAMIYHRQADFELAWANLRQGFDCDSQNKTALQLICQWGLALQKNYEAIVCCLKYLDKKEFDREVSGWLVEQFVAHHNFGSALLETEKLRTFCPELYSTLSPVVLDLNHQCEKRSQWI